MKNEDSISDKEPNEKRPLGRSKCKWEDNIGMHIKETGWQGVDWMHLA
jgi:hypothetical protein